MEKLLKRGAEAELLESKFEGKRCLVKRRVKKSYRMPSLDLSIRKQRTKKEAGLIRQANSIGLNVPKIFSVKEDCFEIAMEFLEGKRAKDVLSSKNFQKICFEIGKNVAKLHLSGIIHGDLTTSNLILKEKKLYFIDFGLGFYGKKTEDRAVDLLNLKKTFQATHCVFFEKGWQEICKAYCAETKESATVKHVVEIEKRARYF